MTGAKGTVVVPLTPVGTIMIMGEYWKAKSLDGDIDVDENVEVVGLEGGLRLKVKHEGR
jgi:membrane-bound ClpP family serine protease